MTPNGKLKTQRRGRVGGESEEHRVLGAGLGGTTEIDMPFSEPCAAATRAASQWVAAGGGA